MEVFPGISPCNLSFDEAPSAGTQHEPTELEGNKPPDNDGGRDGGGRSTLKKGHAGGIQ